MVRILFLLLGGLLTGCSTVPQCKPIEVQVPVRVPCVQAMPVKPAYEIDRLDTKSTDFDKVQALSIDYLTQKQYINALEAVIEGCK